MEQVPLTAQKRTIAGRKVKKIRRDGQIPAHVFGHKVKSINIQVSASEFGKVFEKVGETGIIDLAVDGEKKPVLVKNVQIHAVSQDPLHIDFYQVNLSEKVKVDVPLEIVGESPAAEKKLGLLLTPVSELEIEALPTDLPEKVEVNVEKLENVGDEVKVKDLSIDKSKIEVHADDDLVVAQIGELVTKEMEATEAEIEAEQEEAKESEEVATGEAKKTEGEGVKEEGKEAEAKEGDDKKTEASDQKESKVQPEEGKKE